jgi:uncharacterized protein (DUF779 family)
MVTLFGTTYYTIGTGLLVLALLAPLLWGFARWALRPNVEGKPRRTRLLAEGGLTAGLLLLAAVGLYWDVYLIGQRAKELCEQTGLVVYGTTPSRSFLGSSDIPYWSNYGFDFVEDTVSGRQLRFSIDNGQEVRTEVDMFLSRVQLITETNDLELAKNPKRVALPVHVDKIIDRENGSVLGKLTEYTIRWGWADRTLIALSGIVATPRVCGKNTSGAVTTDDGRLGLEALVTSVLTR